MLTMLKFLLYHGNISFSNPIIHVSSGAFTQARLGAGSASAQVCSGLLTLFTRLLEIINFFLPWLGILNIYLI
jgi:hypothetical protein